MQLIWISGSTAQVKRISISHHDLIMMGVFICALFTFLGIGIHFYGFRIVIQMRPELARQMGGVITTQEQSQIETHYREGLKELQVRLDQTTKTINELSIIKDRMANLATPAQIKNRINEANINKGGPLRPIHFKENESGNLDANLNETIIKAQELHSITKKLPAEWLRQYQWLNLLPTGSPMAGQLGLSSNYGSRIDPITRAIAFHPGIDFNAPSGSKILSAGDGVVTKAGVDLEYGRHIEIEHIDGLRTKYAHAQKLFTKLGDKVTRGQIIGEVGTTGRSTGPHLHYEVHQGATLLNPSMFLIGSRNN